MEPNKKKQGLLKSLILALLAVMLVVAAVYWVVKSRAWQQEVARASQALALAEQANAALENESYAVGRKANGDFVFGFDEAIPRYEEILTLYPEEALPYRNLAIARLLMLTASDSQEGSQSSSAENGEAESIDVGGDSAENRKLAIEAVERYLAIEKGAIGYWLQGWLLEKAGVSSQMQPKIAEQYELAAQDDPDRAEYWYSLLKAAEEYPPHSLEKRKLAIENLLRLEPGNVFVAVNGLQDWAVEDLASARERWEQLRPNMQRINMMLQQYRGNDSQLEDLSGYIEAIDTALENENLEDLFGVTSLLRNVLTSKDPYKSAVSALSLNPLDLLATEFSPAVQAMAIESNDGFVGESVLPTFAAEVPSSKAKVALDFELIDVNFDGVQDGIVLREGLLQIQRGPLVQGESSFLKQVEIDGKWSGITAGFVLTIADGSNVDNKIRESEGNAKTVIAQNELPQIMIWGQDGIEIQDLTWTKEEGYQLSVLQTAEDFPGVRNVTAVSLLDYDQDADLDLAVATKDGLRLLMNRGDKTFVDQTRWATGEISSLSLQQMQIVDWDRDLDIDIIGLDTSGQLHWLENRLFGVFQEGTFNRTLPAAAQFSIADFDGNASWDLLLDGTVFFTETRDWGRVSFLTESLAVPGWGKGNPVAVGDFNNDMVNDIVGADFAVMGQLNGKWSGQGTKRFSFKATDGDTKFSDVEVLKRADLNGDGLLDFMTVQKGNLTSHLNTTKTQNHWIAVVPRGRGDNASKINHLAIGGLFEARVNGRYYAETVTRSTIHFGLGDQDELDVARILWPNGIPQSLLLSQGNQRVEMLYILKGSCPFIYVWGEEGWEFLSDCLWAAPIGLQASSGGLVPTRSWEYLRIDSGRLAELDGQYRIMVTEELWETAYFDHVRLQTIDHPAGTEVHINDKVGPPSIVEHRLYLVQEKRAPIAARDKDGRDVLKTILQQDQVYFKGFQKRMTQGFVEDHWLELDLGPEINDQTTLFLTGWIQPTDTSINVLLRQNPGTDGPVFPAMEVIDETGNWVPASRPLGFPGGKTKTMSVPMAGLFPTSDHRLRLRTSNEIYWDHVFLADCPDPSDSDIRVQECDLVAAQMKFRGTSRRKPAEENGPELFDARDVSVVSAWPPVSGPMSQYGDSLDLVRDADDAMAILGTGDALQLSFDNPGPVPEGWKRTFVFYSVGYDKDADLNTLAGQDSRPLPFRQMAAYPEYRTPSIEMDYLQQSSAKRTQSWYRFWHQIRNPEVVHSRQEIKVPVESN